MNNTITQYEYRVLQTQYTIQGRTYTVYGISVYEQAFDNSPIALVRKVPNISLSMSRVADLVERCNRLQPSPIHLDDIIEDFLP